MGLSRVLLLLSPNFLKAGASLPALHHHAGASLPGGSVSSLSGVEAGSFWKLRACSGCWQDRERRQHPCTRTMVGFGFVFGTGADRRLGHVQVSVGCLNPPGSAPGLAPTRAQMETCRNRALFKAGFSLFGGISKQGSSCYGNPAPCKRCCRQPRLWLVLLPPLRAPPAPRHLPPAPSPRAPLTPGPAFCLAHHPK